MTFLPEEPTTVADAITIAEKTVGKTFAEINTLKTFENTSGNNSKNKGFLGNLYQENVFGQKPNSDKDPDLKVLGIEVKVVPLKRNRQGELIPKERVVANIINFHEEDLTGDFTKSSYYTKNSQTLFIFYEVLDSKNSLNNKIVKIVYHDIVKSRYFDIIQTDYSIIINKIKQGKAHTLSERDTTFLGACTKGSGHGKDLRSQPHNSVLAKQRAYSLKPAYIRELIK